MAADFKAFHHEIYCICMRWRYERGKRVAIGMREHCVSLSLTSDLSPFPQGNKGNWRAMESAPVALVHNFKISTRERIKDLLLSFAFCLSAIDLQPAISTFPLLFPAPLLFSSPLLSFLFFALLDEAKVRVRKGKQNRIRSYLDIEHLSTLPPLFSLSRAAFEFPALLLLHPPASSLRNPQFSSLLSLSLFLSLIPISHLPLLPVLSCSALAPLPVVLIVAGGPFSVLCLLVRCSRSHSQPLACVRSFLVRSGLQSCPMLPYPCRRTRPRPQRLSSSPQ